MAWSMYGTYMNANVGPAAPAISPKPAVKKPDSALREIYTIAIVGVVFLLIALTFYTHSDGAGRSAVVFIIIAVGVAYTITFHEHHMVCFDDAAASTSTPPAAPGQPLATPPSLIIQPPQPISVTPTPAPIPPPILPPGPAPVAPIAPIAPILPAPIPIAPFAPVIPTPAPNVILPIVPRASTTDADIASADKLIQAAKSAYYRDIIQFAQANPNIEIPTKRADTVTAGWTTITTQLNFIIYRHEPVRAAIYNHMVGQCRAQFDQYLNVPRTQWHTALSETHAYLTSVVPNLGMVVLDLNTETIILWAIYLRRNAAAGIPDEVGKYTAKKMHAHIFRLHILCGESPQLQNSDFITAECHALANYITKLYSVQAASATKTTDILSHMCRYFTPRQIQYRFVACRPSGQPPLSADIVQYLADRVSADDAKFADMCAIHRPQRYNSPGGTISNYKLYGRYKREFAEAGSDDNKASVRLRYGLEVRPKNATAETNYTKFAQLLVGCTKENNTNANAIKDMLGCAVAAFSRPVVEMQLKAEIKRHSKKGRAVIDWTAYLAGGEFALPIPAP